MELFILSKTENYHDINQYCKSEGLDYYYLMSNLVKKVRKPKKKRDRSMRSFCQADTSCEY